jgi:hypothetical protein
MDMMNDAPSWTSSAISASELAENEEALLMSMRMMRKGKWTEEEETYTMKLIEAFIAGVLPLTQGTTLRSFLSEKLCW